MTVTYDPTITTIEPSYWTEFEPLEVGAAVSRGTTYGNLDGETNVPENPEPDLPWPTILTPGPPIELARGECATNPKYTYEDFLLEGRFPKNSAAHVTAKKKAKAACAICPVMLLCRKYAIDHNMRGGIWGGMTEVERDQSKWPRTWVDGKWVYDKKGGTDG